MGKKNQKQHQSKKESVGKSRKKEFSISVKELKKLEGNYWNNKNKSSSKLQVIDGVLNYVRSNGSKTKMHPIAKNKFQIVGSRTPIYLEVKNNIHFGT